MQTVLTLIRRRILCTVCQYAFYGTLDIGSFLNKECLFTIVQIIFHFLWDHLAHCGIFENGVLLMYTPEGVSSVAKFITAYEESH